MPQYIIVTPTDKQHVNHDLIYVEAMAKAEAVRRGVKVTVNDYYTRKLVAQYGPTGNGVAE